MTLEQVQERQRQLRQQVVLLTNDQVWDESRVAILKTLSILEADNKRLKESCFELNKQLEEHKRIIQTLSVEARVR